MSIIILKVEDLFDLIFYLATVQLQKKSWLDLKQNKMLKI